MRSPDAWLGTVLPDLLPLDTVAGFDADEALVNPRASDEPSEDNE